MRARSCGRCRWKDSRLVSGTRRVGPARTRQSQHRRRSAASRHERHFESPYQASRDFPPVCAVGIGGIYRRVVRESHPSPFMTMAYAVRPEKRPQIPAPTHIDGTGRLQTVTREANPRYWQLIRAFEQATGVPIVLNTSFNDNEPIVCRPEEALDCFQRTQMDALALGDFFITKQ